MAENPATERLAAQLREPPRGLPPVHAWNTPLNGDLEIRIARDGRWYHEGAEMTRQALVRLFSTVLRRDDDGDYYLVTPVEKWRIRVDDAPFVAVAVEVEGRGAAQRLTFVTNLGERVCADAAHPLRVELDPQSGAPAPYVRVRDRLDALLGRAVYFELAELGEARVGAAGMEFGVWSCGQFFPLGRLDE